MVHFSGIYRCWGKLNPPQEKVFMIKKKHIFTALLIAAAMLAGSLPSAAQGAKRNIVIFVADGLRTGSVNSTDAPTMLSIRQNGVFFSNSHSIFPTFTMPNGS